MTKETHVPSSHKDWQEDTDKLFTTVQLPCGRTMPNRLVKAAMYEHMSALFGGPPNATHLALYTRWAAGGWGMVCTGNVQVCSDHLTLGRDMVVPVSLTAETIEPYAQLARVIHYGSSDGEGKGEPGTLAIMQLSHPGRQSTNVIGGRWPFVPPLAPSAVPVGRVASKGEGYASALLSHLVHTVFFQTPRPMGLSDIENVVSSFVRGAELAAESGFDGVQLHAAHGYLISQFMSPKTNWREDRYGAPDNALRFLREIVCAIREHDKISSNFVLGVKLNAADYVDCRSGGQPAEQQNQALQHVCEIARWGMLDFIEVSGGDYEDPAFLTENKSGRQAFFTEFAREVKQTLASSQASNPPLILLTGGLRTLPRMSSVLDHDYADLLGIGRLSVLCPDLPRTLEAAKTGDFRDNCFPWEPLPEPDLASPTTAHAQHFVSRSLIPLITRCWAGLPVHFPKLVGAGAVMAWYMVMMRRIAANEEVDYSVGGVEAVLRMWLWLAPSSGRHIDGGFIACVLDSWWAMGMLGVFLGLVLGISFNP